MGYKRRTLRLVFEADEYEGLEVHVRPMSIGQLLDLIDDDPADDRTAAQKLDRYLPYLAGALLSWNVEEPDGSAVPVTLDGLRSLDMGFLLDLVHAWSAAAAGVSRPLALPSPDGPPLEELSLPMEVLSGSPLG